MKRAISHLATVDCLFSLAEVAKQGDYCRWCPSHDDHKYWCVCCLCVCVCFCVGYCMCVRGCPVSCPIVSDRLCVGVCTGLSSVLCQNTNISPTHSHTHTQSHAHLFLLTISTFFQVLFLFVPFLNLSFVFWDLKRNMHVTSSHLWNKNQGFSFIKQVCEVPIFQELSEEK